MGLNMARRMYLLQLGNAVSSSAYDCLTDFCLFVIFYKIRHEYYKRQQDKFAINLFAKMTLQYYLERSYILVDNIYRNRGVFFSVVLSWERSVDEQR